MDRRKEFFVILASTEESVGTYSSVMRELNKQDSEKRKLFMRKFKDAFDAALDADNEDHQQVALMSAQKVLAHSSERFVKLAQTAVGIGNNPNEVGKTVADIVKVILKQVMLPG